MPEDDEEIRMLIEDIWELVRKCLGIVKNLEETGEEALSIKQR